MRVSGGSVRGASSVLKSAIVLSVRLRRTRRAPGSAATLIDHRSVPQANAVLRPSTTQANPKMVAKTDGFTLKRAASWSIATERVTTLAHREALYTETRMQRSAVRKRSARRGRLRLTKTAAFAPL